MTRTATVAGLIATALLIAAATPSLAQAGPSYDPAGNLVLPANYETWMFVGSNLGLVYKHEVAAMTLWEGARADNQVFHNIYLDPASYAAFMATGEFPDPTVLMMELYVAEAKDAGGVLSEASSTAAARWSKPRLRVRGVRRGRGRRRSGLITPSRSMQPESRPGRRAPSTTAIATTVTSSTPATTMSGFSSIRCCGGGSDSGQLEGLATLMIRIFVHEGG